MWQAARIGPVADHGAVIDRQFARGGLVYDGLQVASAA
jgi:hypothetical protein